METNRDRIRKKLWVDPIVQGALLRRLLLHWFSAMVAGAFVLLLLQIFANGVDRPFAYHLHSLWQTYGPLLVVMICLFPAFAYDSIKLSNRFAGPVYATRMAIKSLAEGTDIPDVTFRKGDFWTDIASDINRLAARQRRLRGDATGSLVQELREVGSEPMNVGH